MKLAVIGKDVSQSDSPKIHSFILRAMGVKCSYDRISIPPAEFSQTIGGIFRDYDAFNVTIPFKGSVIPYLKRLQGDARAFGAVNTVVCNRREGYNTDGYGFGLMLQTEGIGTKGARVLVLGAGGAGRSCIKTLASAGAKVFVYERDEERLYTVYRELGGFTPVTEIPPEPFDVAVNCTGVGMHDTEGKTPVVQFAGGEYASVGENLLERCGAAVDLIYTPPQSEFLRIAASLKKPAVNGAPMLFYQAYAADCIFTGRIPSAEEAKPLWEGYRKEKS